MARTQGDRQDYAPGSIVQVASVAIDTSDRNSSSSTPGAISGLSLSFTPKLANSTIKIELGIGVFSNDTSGDDSNIQIYIDGSAADATNSTGKVFSRAGASSPVDYKPGSTHTIVTNLSAAAHTIAAYFWIGVGGVIHVGAGVAGSRLTVTEYAGGI